MDLTPAKVVKKANFRTAVAPVALSIYRRASPCPALPGSGRFSGATGVVPRYTPSRAQVSIHRDFGRAQTPSNYYYYYYYYDTVAKGP